MFRLFLLAMLLAVPAGAQDLQFFHGRPPAGGGGGATDYTADGSAYAYWDFNATDATVCDDVLNSNDLTEQGTLDHETTLAQEGAAAIESTANAQSCKATVAATAPWNCSGTGCAWSITLKRHNVETGVSTIQPWLQIGDNSSGNNVLIVRQNNDTLLDFRIGGGNSDNLLTVASGTDFSLAIVYDGDASPEWNFYLDGGSGGSCSGSVGTSTRTPDTGSTNEDEIELNGGDGADLLGVMDDVFVIDRALSQTEVCEIHLNCADGTCA